MDHTNMTIVTETYLVLCCIRVRDRITSLRVVLAVGGWHETMWRSFLCFRFVLGGGV